ncbi:armadillo repeat-containing protein 10 [Lepisosteus oculatus]|uniref:armadillo repeat-containing protein 10 n=1 Tax=Lepisosteus oculatus TaxID=7918 RepID=UPI0007402F09|nr:PREDICTED: armadillo repeat-containing protein 10 isoform X1 [Lepisosteus oculatus]
MADGASVAPSPCKMKVLLGLLAGAGATYGIYKLVTASRNRANQSRNIDVVNEHCSGKDESTKAVLPGSLLEKVFEFSSIRGRDVRTGDGSSREILSKTPGKLDPQHLEMLLSLLQSNPDTSERMQILVTLGNSAAFSVNQDFIRETGGLKIIGNLLSDPVFGIRVQALNALNNLSMNAKNQEQLKEYIPKVLEMIEISAVNSDIQLAALRLLTNLSVTNDYHHMMRNSITLFLSLLVVGNEGLQTQVLKVLVNLSANPEMVDDILRAQAPASLVLLFDSGTVAAVLCRVLTFVGNLTNWTPSTPTKEALKRSKDSLYSVLFGDSSQLPSKLSLLLCHPDTEVTAQVARFFT